MRRKTGARKRCWGSRQTRSARRVVAGDGREIAPPFLGGVAEFKWKRERDASPLPAFFRERGHVPAADFGLLAAAPIRALDRAKNLSVRTPAQVARQLNRKEKDVRNSIQSLAEADIYLRDWANAEGEYSRVAEDAEQLFNDLPTLLQGKDQQLKEASRAIAWTYYHDRPSFRLLAEQPEHGCDLCSRYRRRAVYEIARGLGANVIALGHTADDFCEAFLRNAVFDTS